MTTTRVSDSRLQEDQAKVQKVARMLRDIEAYPHEVWDQEAKRAREILEGLHILTLPAGRT